MGFFSNLMEKKSCGICDKELGLLGKRKLEDGWLCKDCASKLSPFFGERRSSTLAQIEEQLAYREANKGRVAKLQVTRTMGGATKVLVDEDARAFIVTDQGRAWRDKNPDVIDFSQVTGCDWEVKETQTEIYRTNSEGERESYMPPRYDTDYDIWISIFVNSPWFDEISFKVNERRIEQTGGPEYASALAQAEEIKDVLCGIREDMRSRIEAERAPKAASSCPHCGATTIPDANGRCEYCGGAMV